MRKNFFYNFLLTGSNLLLPLLTFPYVSRVLGADGLGIYNFIISFGQNFIILAALGIPIYGMRETAKIGDNRQKRSKLFWELITLHLIFTCFLLLIYCTSIYLYADLRAYKDLALLGGALILFNVFSFEWLFSGLNNFKYITIRSLVIRTISIIAVFLLVKEKNDYFIYLIITTITVLLTVIINTHYCKRFISRKASLSTSGLLLHLKPISYLGIFTVLTTSYSVLPSTLLGFLSTKSAVGYYYAANKIIRMVISVFTALITVMIPTLNHVAEQKKTEEYITLINKSLNIVIGFGIPISFLVFLLADPIVMLLAGSDFDNSIYLIKVMSPVVLLVAFAQIFILLILSVYRKDKEMVLLAILGMTISIVINLVFIPHFAERAAGFAQLVAEICVTLFAFILTRKVLKFEFPIKKLLLNLACVIPFILITNIANLLFDDHLLMLSFSASICAIYFLCYQQLIIKDGLINFLTDPYIAKIKKMTTTSSTAS